MLWSRRRKASINAARAVLCAMQVVASTKHLLLPGASCAIFWYGPGTRGEKKITRTTTAASAATTAACNSSNSSQTVVISQDPLCCRYLRDRYQISRMSVGHMRRVSYCQMIIWSIKRILIYSYGVSAMYYWFKCILGHVRTSSTWYFVRLSATLYKRTMHVRTVYVVLGIL